MLLSGLKKKHSKIGEESRFQGTILGIGADIRPVKIDGGPESIREWMAMNKASSAAKRQKLNNSASVATQDTAMTIVE